jgi:hypothetical protein
LFHFDGRCAYCFLVVDASSAHLEHCVPLTRGGSNSPENIVLSCATCNHRKRTKTPLEFLAGIAEISSALSAFPKRKTETTDATGQLAVTAA